MYLPFDGRITSAYVGILSYSRCDTEETRITRNYWGTSDDELLAEEIQTFVWARRRRGSTRGGLWGQPEGAAGSGCLAAPDLGFGPERILLAEATYANDYVLRPFRVH